MKTIIKNMLILSIAVCHLNAQTGKSELSEMMGDLFFYDRQNSNNMVEEGGVDNIQNLKDDYEKVSAILAEKLDNIIKANNLQLTFKQQEDLLKEIMEAKVMSNNELFAAISNNNRIAVDLINQFFDQFIVNNTKNVFVGQKTTNSDYSKFISHNNDETPPLEDGENNKIVIVPVDFSNTVGVPLTILGKQNRSCQVHFKSFYDNESPTNTKIFYYKNNKINWLRINDVHDEPNSCSNLYGTMDTSDYTCELLNSHGNVYKEKIIIPGAAYIYTPMVGSTPDTHIGAVPCPTSITNGNIANYETSFSTNDCPHYFDYIKYVINYRINLGSGDLSIEIKENFNPFDEEMQRYLIPTKAFLDDKEYSLINPNKNIYDPKLAREFDIIDIESQLRSIVSLNGNIFRDPTLASQILSRDCGVKPLVVKNEIKKLIDNLLKETYFKMTEYKEPMAGNTCILGYTYNNEFEKCIKDDCLNGFIDAGNGICTKNNETTLFKPTDIYKYLSAQD